MVRAAVGDTTTQLPHLLVNERHLQAQGKAAAIKAFEGADKLTCASCALTHDVQPCGSGEQHGAHACTWCPTWWQSDRACKTHMGSCKYKTRQFGAASGTARAVTHRKAQLYYDKYREKVTCESEKVDFSLRFPYLGNMLAGDGSDLVDVLYRMQGACGTWTKLRKSLCNKRLKLPIRLGLYKVCVCSTLRYSSEAWIFTTAAKRRINDFNSKRLAAITGFSPEQMASDPPFCLVTGIRRTRLIWLGHILRLTATNGTRLALLA